MKASCNVYLDDNDVICIQGNINFDNVLEVKQLGDDLMATVVFIKVNLEQVAKADSSSLVLLSAWIRIAKTQHKEILFYNLPQFIKDLCRVYGLDTILPLSKQ